MCTCRIDLSHILRAFSKGADGVFIGGCHLNECNYLTNGNFHALSMVKICRKMMQHIGLNPERLRIEFMSGSEANLFVEGVNNFVKIVKGIGPLGKSEGIDKKGLKFKLDAVTELIPYLRLVERERLRMPFKSAEEYDEFFNSDEANRLFKELITDKLAVGQILSLLREGPMTTGEMAKMLGLTPSEVSRHMNTSSRHGLVRYDVNQKSYALA